MKAKYNEKFKNIKNLCYPSCLYLGSHLPIEKILRIIHLWSTQTQVGKTMEELEVCNKQSK